MYEHLIEQTTKNVSQLNNVFCDYAETIADNKFMYQNPYVDDLIDGTDIKTGGEYLPQKCSPKFSTAIIVAYRQREEQLQAFLIYMHNYLRKQQIHYRIFIVEQFDQKAFNRAMLFNIGVLQAIQHGFPCIILHDVDLMPLRLGNLYACSRQPRHMSSSLDKFRYNLPYHELFGGAVAIETKVYQHVNGMSNMVDAFPVSCVLWINLFLIFVLFLTYYEQFRGWGGEDDDLYGRLHNKGIEICRFAPEYGQYTMLKHSDEQKSQYRHALLRNSSERYDSDGLNALDYQLKEIKLHNLFTHILAVT